MYDIKLQWKEFSVSVPAVCSAVAVLAVQNVEACANSQLVLHLPEEPTEEIKTAILAYWNGLTAESSEAVGYVPAASLAEAKIALKESAKAKLAALGLTPEELSAILS